MKQTLLALLALLIATLLSFSQKQAMVQGQTRVVQSEMEQMALGVADHAMEMIRTRAFDAASTIEATGDLTPESEFPSGNRCKVFFPSSSTECTAIEDFHGMDVATTSFEFPGDSFQFEIKSVEVTYVDENFASTSNRTFQKKVTLRVQDAPTGGGDPRLPSPIEYSDVVSFP